MLQQLQSSALAILDKVRALLTTEPARLIGYGAAVVVFLVTQVLQARGITLFPEATFDEVVTIAFTSIATLVVIVESIRRFVYSPLTYIEDLADESAAAHEAAHLEEEMQRAIEKAMAEQAADAAPKKRAVVVGTAQSDGGSGKTN